MELIYRVEATLGEPTSVGAVDHGVRLDVPFEGNVTDGLLAGAKAGGLDYVIQRRDGVAAVEARDAFELPDGGVVYAHARGYSVPPEGTAMPPPEAALAPDFEPPDLWVAIRAFALCETRVPGFETLNHTVVQVRGRLNAGLGELVFEGYGVPFDQSELAP